VGRGFQVCPDILFSYVCTNTLVGHKTVTQSDKNEVRLITTEPITRCSRHQNEEHELNEKTVLH